MLSRHSPLLDGHLFGGHAVRRKVYGLGGGQQIGRMGTVPAEVLVGVQGLGKDRSLGEALRFGGRLQVGLRERLDESLRSGLRLRGLRGSSGVRRRGLTVGRRFGRCGRRLLGEGFGESLRRLQAG